MEGLVRMHVDRAERVAIDGPATIAHATAAQKRQRLPATVKLVNLSRTGCLFQSASPPEIGSSLSIGIPGVGTRNAIVVRSGGDGVGCTFTEWLLEAEIDAARTVRAVAHLEASAAIRTLRRAFADRAAQDDGDAPSNPTWRGRLARWRSRS